MSPCIECGMYDGMHWHWCKQEPIEEWAGVVSSRKMTREEIYKEYPSSAAAQPRSEDK